MQNKMIISNKEYALREQIFQSNEIMQIFVENAKQNDHIKLKESALCFNLTWSFISINEIMQIDKQNDHIKWICFMVNLTLMNKYFNQMR